MTGRKNRSQPLSSGKRTTDLHCCMDSDESLRLNKTAVHHQSTSIETLSKYTISVLGPDPSTHTLTDNCLENLEVEAVKKQISEKSKESTDSEVLVVSAESSESKVDVQKSQSNNHFHFSFYFNAPVSNISLDFHIKPLEKPHQSTHDNLPQIQLKVHSQHSSSGSPEVKTGRDYIYMQENKSASETFTNDGQRNIAASSQRKDREGDEEGNSSQTSRYSKISKRTKSRSVGRERKIVETEETRRDMTNHKSVSGKQFPDRRIADVFDLTDHSRKKEAVKSKRKAKSKMKKSKVPKNQRSLSQYVIRKTPDVIQNKVDEAAFRTNRFKQGQRWFDEPKIE